MVIFNQHSRTAMIRLGLFAGICIFSIALLYFAVNPRIVQQNKTHLLSSFQAILPDTPLTAQLLDNAQQQTLGEHPITLYTTEKGIHFIRTSTGKGYAGEIILLIGIAQDNKTLLGVRTLAHQETPGLGDKIDSRKSNWIQAFAGKTLGNTTFKVRKDGGDFDAFTGATITPRAVTELVGETLKNWQATHEH